MSDKFIELKPFYDAANEVNALRDHIEEKLEKIEDHVIELDHDGKEKALDKIAALRDDLHERLDKIEDYILYPIHESEHALARCWRAVKALPGRLWGMLTGRKST